MHLRLSQRSFSGTKHALRNGTVDQDFHAGGYGPVFDTISPRSQYELNTQWAHGLSQAIECFESDRAKAKRVAEDSLEKIRELNNLLVAGDEHPEIFTEMSKLQKAEELASVTGLPKGDLLKILKIPQDSKAKILPNRLRFEPYARPSPFSGSSGSGILAHLRLGWRLQWAT